MSGQENVPDASDAGPPPLRKGLRAHLFSICSDRRPCTAHKSPRARYDPRDKTIFPFVFSRGKLGRRSISAQIFHPATTHYRDGRARQYFRRTGSFLLQNIGSGQNRRVLHCCILYMNMIKNSGSSSCAHFMTSCEDGGVTWGGRPAGRWKK